MRAAEEKTGPTSRVARRRRSASPARPRRIPAHRGIGRQPRAPKRLHSEADEDSAPRPSISRVTTQADQAHPQSPSPTFPSGRARAECENQSSGEAGEGVLPSRPSPQTASRSRATMSRVTKVQGRVAATVWAIGEDFPAAGGVGPADRLLLLSTGRSLAPNRSSSCAAYGGPEVCRGASVASGSTPVQALHAAARVPAAPQPIARIESTSPRQTLSNFPPAGAEHFRSCLRRRPRSR